MSAGIGTQWANAIRAVNVRQRNADAPGWFDSELAWFVNERDGDMGVRGVPIEPGIGADPTEHDGISDNQVRAATRSRHIEAALAVLSPNTRLLLQAVHARISPHAHKEKHEAQARCIAAREGEIVIAVAVFRREYAKRGRKC